MHLHSASSAVGVSAVIESFHDFLFFYFLLVRCKQISVPFSVRVYTSKTHVDLHTWMDKVWHGMGNLLSQSSTYINIWLYTCTDKYCILYIDTHIEVRLFVVHSQHEVYIYPETALLQDPCSNWSAHVFAPAPSPL